MRTSAEAVRKVVPNLASIDMTEFLITANALTDKIAASDSQSLLNDALLAEIEKYLAAHFYALFDQQYESKSTDGAAARFQGQTGMGFDATHWGQMAKRLDLTGFLASMDRTKQTAGMTWLGKPKSEQIRYEDRD